LGKKMGGKKVLKEATLAIFAVQKKPERKGGKPGGLGQNAVKS